MHSQWTQCVFWVAAFAVAFLKTDVAAKCPSLPDQRSEFVKTKFNPALLTGVWYEHRYIDIAQIGAECQILNGTYEANSLAMDFAVKYDGIPFTIVELYNETKIPGYYIKRAKMPGSKLLEFPTVIVDVKAPADGTDYTRLTMSSCVMKLDLPITELVFATRVKNESQAIIEEMEAVARKQGVQWDEKKLKAVDWTKRACANL